MKKFCLCNGKWEHELEWLEERNLQDQSQRICRLVFTEQIPSLGDCPHCNVYEWYDADFENHMHTLKEMNS